MRMTAAAPHTLGCGDIKNFKLVLFKEQGGNCNDFALFRFEQCKKNYLGGYIELFDNVTSLKSTIGILLKQPAGYS